MPPYIETIAGLFNANVMRKAGSTKLPPTAQQNIGQRSFVGTGTLTTQISQARGTKMGRR
jgi:hypothetical protein